MKTHGFTLIELMIVVAIIAIIAAIAIPSLLRSRIAANQTAAVAASKTFATAEELYHRTDYNTDGVLEYAQKLGGDWSLLETKAGKNDLGLIDRNFASAEGLVATGAIPKAGYTFQVLTTQGTSAPGGTRSYISSKRMTLYFALSALPAWYDGTGRDSYMISNVGVVYQFDRGSAASTAHMTLFDPTPGLWTPTE